MKVNCESQYCEIRVSRSLDEAEKLFYRLLSQYPAEDSKLCNEFARISPAKGLYETGLQLYEKFLIKI
jgi:hypothetical protein